MRLANLGKIGLFTSLFTSPLVGCAGEQITIDPSESEAEIQLATVTGLATTPTTTAVFNAPTGQPITVTGNISGVILYSIGGTGTQTNAFSLTDANKASYSLSLTDAQLSQLGLSRGGQARGVTVTGTLVDKTITASQVSMSALLGPPAPTVVTGTRKFATFYFRLPGQPFEPFQPSEAALYFDALFGNTAPGLGDYFTKASRGLLKFESTGFDVFTFDLEGELEPFFVNGQIPDAQHLTELLLKCAEIIGETAYLPDYDGLNFTFNKDFGFGHDTVHQFYGAMPLDLSNNGIFKTYAATILTPSAFRSQAITAQAIATSLSLPRTGSANNHFDSDWDLMSSGGLCSSPVASFGCVGVLPNTETRVNAGWIPTSKVVSAGPGYTELLLNRADAPIVELPVVVTTGTVATAMASPAPASPTPVSNAAVSNVAVSNAAVSNASLGKFLWHSTPPVVGKVSLGNGKHYSLEFRAPTPIPTDGTPRVFSYENELPGQGVVIHRYLDQPATYTADIVDANNNLDPNDPGSALTPGGEYYDTANKILIKVMGYEGDAVRVGIANQTVPVTVSTPSHGRVESTGIKCGQSNTDCSENVPVGSTVTLRAIPAAGYVFDSWSGCSSSSATCSVVAKRSINVTATFKVPPIDDEDPLPPVCKVKPYLPVCKGLVP